MTVVDFTPSLRHRIAMAIMESGLNQKVVDDRPSAEERWGHLLTA